MLTIQKVGPALVMLHPSSGRRATFVRVGNRVRYTLYGSGGRRHEELTVPEARRRWVWLVGLGYRRWEAAR